MPRKHREGEYTCDCPAYNFPHRMFGGKCDGQAWAENYWNENYGGSGECGQCMCFDEKYTRCEVAEGQEDPTQCRALRDFVRYHEIVWDKKRVQR